MCPEYVLGVKKTLEARKRVKVACHTNGKYRNERREGDSDNVERE